MIIGLAQVKPDKVDGSVGERRNNSNFSTHHQEQSMESSSNEREKSASTYPCRSRAEAFN